MIRFEIGEDFDRKIDLFLFATASISIEVLIVSRTVSYGRIDYEGYIMKQKQNKWIIYYKEYGEISFQALFANYDLALIYLCEKIVGFDKVPAIFQVKKQWEAIRGVELDWLPP